MSNCYNSELPIGLPGPVGPQGPQGIQGPIGPSSGGIIVFKTTNSVASIIYTPLDNLSITNLVNDNDTIEIESVIRYLNADIDTTMDGYKFQVNAVDVHEFTSAQFDNTDFKFLIHKATITRVSSTIVNIISEIKVTNSNSVLIPKITILSPQPIPSQTFAFNSLTVANAAILPITFLLESSNATDDANKGTQVVLRINYIPKYTA
jgi:hypothetical protein